jgi:hypothetical protein
MPLESAITRSIQKYAASRGWWTLKVHGGPFQTAGIPDLLCVKHGLAVFLEVKQPGKYATKLQNHRIAEIKNVGGAVAEVVKSVDEAREVLDGVDNQQRRPASRSQAVGVEARDRRERQDSQETDTDR